MITQQSNSHLYSYTGGTSSGEGKHNLFSRHLLSSPTPPNSTQSNPTQPNPIQPNPTQPNSTQPNLLPATTHGPNLHPPPPRPGGIMSNSKVTIQPRPRRGIYHPKKAGFPKAIAGEVGGGVRQRDAGLHFQPPRLAAEAIGSRAVPSDPRQRGETPGK